MGIAQQSRAPTPGIEALIERGAETECLELSEISELIADLGLEDADVDLLFERIERRGIEISDDCGRQGPEHVTYGNQALATKTTDAMDLFFAEVRRFDLLSATEEVELAKRIEEGDEHAK